MKSPILPEKVKRILKIISVILFMPIAIAILLIISLYLSIYVNTQSTKKIEVGQTVCVNAPFYFPDRIRTDSTQWDTQSSFEDQFIQNIYSNEKCFTQSQFSNSTEDRIPLSYRLAGDLEVNIGEIKVEIENKVPEINTTVINKDSIKVEIKNGSPYMYYTMELDGADIHCSRLTPTLAECVYKFENPANEKAYIPHSITISSSTDYFAVGTVYKSLVMQGPDNIIEVIYDSTKPEIFCAGKSSCILGSTVGGIPIEAKVYGTGNKRVFLFGAMHGSEGNSTDLMNQVISAIENKQMTIPQDKQVIIIPAVNIDGYNQKKRLNLNSVDLNRNFPSKDWQSDSYLTDGQTFKNGGVTKPLSEPESQMLLRFVETVEPYLSISYHSWGKYVIPNHETNATRIGTRYAEISKYIYSDPDEVNTGFNYSVTGTIETWGEEHGYSIMTVELPDLINHDMDNNKAAIQMVFDWK
jgi:hypothetical protein